MSIDEFTRINAFVTSSAAEWTAFPEILSEKNLKIWKILLVYIVFQYVYFFVLFVKWRIMLTWSSVPRSREVHPSRNISLPEEDHNEHIECKIRDRMIYPPSMKIIDDCIANEIFHSRRDSVLLCIIWYSMIIHTHWVIIKNKAIFGRIVSESQRNWRRITNLENESVPDDNRTTSTTQSLLQ